jgi:hypothetical protein
MSANTGNIKAENKKISDDFINLVMDMFGVIDEVSDKIGDGKYLELANQFKKLSEFKEKMGTNVVYIEHERRTHMRVLKKKERRLTYAEKLKDIMKYYKCHKCDCVLTRKERTSHEKTQKCKKIYSSRMITLAKKTKVTSTILILLDDMLDTRRPYYMVETEEGIKEERGKIFTLEDYYMGNADKAAVMIQSLWRGYTVRKNFWCMGENADMTDDDYATRIQSLWRGKSVRMNVKIYDGTGELPNFIKTDTWELFKSAWVGEGKIPIYRLSEYWRKVRNPTDKEARHKIMFDMMKAFIEKKNKNKVMKNLLVCKWNVYRELLVAETKKEFNHQRKMACDSLKIKIKGVSKMSRREIEMEIARQLWK